MTDQNAPEGAEQPNEETAVAPPVTQPVEPSTYDDPQSRRQHLAAAFRGRPVIIAASVVTTLAVGLGGFALALGVGHHDRDPDRIGPVVFERGGIPGGPGGHWDRDFGGPNGMMPPGLDDDQDGDFRDG